MTTTENINAQRRATYGAYSGPIATESTAAWIENTRSTPMSTPYPGAHQAYLLIHEAHGNALGYGVQVGTIRGVQQNEDATTNARYPWRLCDHTQVVANGVVVNDHVSVGDMVWAPGRGQVTVHDVRVQGGRIDTVIARGSGHPINTWFRVDLHSITDRAATPNRPSVAPGDLVVVEDSDSAAALGRVMQVVNDYATSITVEPVGAGSAIHVARSWIVVAKNGSVQEGALVRPLQFLGGATTEYQEWGRLRTFIASGTCVHPGTIRVRSTEAFSATLPAGHETSLRAWEIVGHEGSRHNPQSPDTQPSTTFDKTVEEPEAPASETGDSVNSLRQERDKARQDLADLWAALEQQARERDWCSEYDDFAHENGGPERTTNYRVQVEMQATIGEHTLDEVLRPYLSSANLVPDVQESVTVTNQAYVTVVATRQEMVDTEAKSTKVEQALESDGWIFDSFGVTDWHED